MDKYPRINDLLPKAKRRLPHFSAEYLFSGTGSFGLECISREAKKSIEVGQSAPEAGGAAHGRALRGHLIRILPHFFARKVPG